MQFLISALCFCNAMCCKRGLPLPLCIFRVPVSIVSKWHTETTTLPTTYKKYLLLPQPQIFTTLHCVCVCAWCAAMPAIIYTLLIFHHVTTAAVCLFGCSSTDLHASPLFLSLSSLSLALSLLHTLSFSSCTFALALCALQTVLHFIVYCGCPARLAPWLCLAAVPDVALFLSRQRRRLWLWLLLTPATTVQLSALRLCLHLALARSARMTAKC